MRSGIKKGVTLIELLCSMAIFSMLFIAALTIQLDSLKLKSYSKQSIHYSTFFESIKNNMIYNITYGELQELNLKGRYYISEDKILFYDINDKGIINLFTDVKPQKEPYLVINIQEGDVLKVNLKLFIKQFNNTRVMECEFYKGKYKR